jgi:hypothetical protein
MFSKCYFYRRFSKLLTEIERQKQASWHMSVIPVTQEAEIGGSWFEVSMGKVSEIPISKTSLRSFLLRRSR